MTGALAPIHQVVTQEIRKSKATHTVRNLYRVLPSVVGVVSTYISILTRAIVSVYNICQIPFQIMCHLDSACNVTMIYRSSHHIIYFAFGT